MARRSKREQALNSLELGQLRCKAFRYHAWEDIDMMPMVWGVMKVDHWRLRCTSCGNEATEYRDRDTGERIDHTQRQYQPLPGYKLGIDFAPGEFFQELRTRRLGTPGEKQKYRKADMQLVVLEGGGGDSAADAG